eukprot:Gb_41064 [translate_table: standard]
MAKSCKSMKTIQTPNNHSGAKADPSSVTRLVNMLASALLPNAQYPDAATL